MLFTPGEGMQKQSPTRLTLALDIIGKIQHGPQAGYHELSTVKHQIDLCDTITIEPAKATTIECNHPLVPCDERNICHKAIRLMQQEAGGGREVALTIDKRIPVMGGLAGGSTNAATTLLMLNELWELHLPLKRLMELGRMLGMDVPFYFLGKTAFDTEAGGVCTAIPNVVHLYFVLAIPDFGVSTADAYRGIDYSLIGKQCTQTRDMQQFLLANNRDNVVSCMHNDFELSVFRQFPALVKVKKELLDAGCETAMLSGSGSTILGVAASREQALDIQRKIGYQSIIAETLV